MNPAVMFSVLAGLGWATNIVLVRWALDRTSARPLAGAFVALATATIAVAALALVIAPTFPGVGSLWRFALVGAIAPGSSQGLFVAAIGLIGTSRASVLVSTNPLVSVLLAIVFLGEGWKAVVLVGTLLIVAGGVLISWEPGSETPRVGVLLALATAFTFGVRDVVARHVSTGSDVSPLWAAVSVLTAATLVVGLLVLAQNRGSISTETRRALPWFVPSGLAIAIALTSLFTAFDRDRVSLVAPLSNAAQSLAVVALGAIVFGARERTGHILVALVFVGAGGAIITAA